MSDTTQWFAELEAKAKAATPGPWANIDNAQELLGVIPFDYWRVYTKKNGYRMTVCKTTRRMTKQEKEDYRDAFLKNGFYVGDPGQAGKDADFIAAANPETVLRLVAMVQYLGKELELMQKSPRMNCYFGDVLGKAYQQTEPNS